MCLVTIIVPVYNVEKYIKRCVSSILKQTYDRIEVILVDDGSPDNCGCICDDFKKKDKRIKVIHKENGGLASARNAGLDIAQGQYVCFVDSDDWIDKNYIVEMLKTQKSNSETLVVTEVSIDFINDGISQKIQFDMNFGTPVFVQRGLLEMFKTASFNYAWNKLYNRNIIEREKIRFEVGSEPAEDFIFNSEYIRHVSEVSFAIGTSYHYIRCDESTLTNRYIPDLYMKSKRFNSILRSLYCDFKLSENNELKKIYMETYAYRMFSCVPNLYRTKTLESRKQKIEIYKDMKSNTELSRCLLEMSTSDIHIKIYKCLVLKHSAYFMDFVYSNLFFIRNKFTRLYIFFRKKIREKQV